MTSLVTPAGFQAPSPAPLRSHLPDRPIRFSIIIPCKGRLADLHLTLPFWLAQERAWEELIVVDYGCPDGAAAWIESLTIPGVMSIRVVRDTDRWSASRSRNIGACRASGSHLVFADADAFVPFDYLDRIDRYFNRGYDLVIAGGVNSTGDLCAFGQCAVTTEMFHHSRGCDESHRGYAFEDIEFYSRLEQLGARTAWLLSVSRIETSEEDRVRFLDVEDSQTSQEQNKSWAAELDRAINPTGFGDL